MYSCLDIYKGRSKCTPGECTPGELFLVQIQKELQEQPLRVFLKNGCSWNSESQAWVKFLPHDYNLDETHLEGFLLPYLESCSCFSQLTKIIKFLMVLLDGQSAAERGFIANKNHLVENLHEILVSKNGSWLY